MLTRRLETAAAAPVSRAADEYQLQLFKKAQQARSDAAAAAAAAAAADSAGGGREGDGRC